jgi:hypothetical protein
LDDVKKHPLLKEIVEWRLTPVGKIEVDEVEDRIAFGHVTFEETPRTISRFQKITQIIPRPALETRTESIAQETATQPARWGFLNVGLWTGTFNRNYSTGVTALGKAGSGLLYGARGSSQLWINRDVFWNLDLGVASFGYSQKDLATGTLSSLSGVSGSATLIRSDFGYHFYLSNDVFGPKAWIKAGYQMTGFSIPYDSTESTAPLSSSGVALGAGADLPLRDRLGARLDFEVGILTTTVESSSTNTTPTTSNYGRFYFGGYLKYKPKLHFNLGVEVVTSGATFDTNNIASGKTFSFNPSASFYF